MVSKAVKTVSAVLLATLLVLLPLLPVEAAVPYDSYTYWSDVGAEDKAVYNRATYVPAFELDAASLGVPAFSKINDVSFDAAGNLYILDDASRIVVLDRDYHFLREIGLAGKTESYNEAKSIYLARDNTIYICDTEGHRILHVDPDGGLQNVITLPESDLIPEDFDFRPTNLVIDDYGYTYILSDGSYYGALLYNEQMEFLGFYGANTVKSTLGSVFSNIKNRILPNNTKMSKTAKRLPYCFVDLALDNRGFLYTSTGYTDNNRTGQIRKLGPGIGNNILGSDDVNFVDGRINRTYHDGAVSKQDIFDIEVDADGFVYGLESAFGKVFLYDSACRILSVFGGGMGFGSQVGTFVTVSALAIRDNGAQVLVSDGATNRITVFEITDFGKQVKALVSRTLAGDYAGAKPGWEEVLKIDRNFQPAYGALARAYINEGDYDKALTLAKTGYDRETYAIAFEYKRSELINRHFGVIFTVLILTLAAVITLLVISSRRKLRLIRNPQLRLLFSVLARPSDSFTEVKEKKQGSVLLCVVTVLLFYVVTILQTLKGGFLFTVYDPADFNSFWMFVKTAGLVVLWIVANWMVCTLLGGKGRVREIAVVTCYSLLPLILERALRLVLTNVLLPSEASFLAILDVIAMLYFLLLIAIGLIKIHDFSFGKLVGTSALSLAGVGAIVFLGIMIVILVQQFGGFISTVISELLTL